MIQSLQHLEFIVDHLLISLDVFLQNYLDSHFLALEVRFSYDTIGTGAEGATELVLGLLVVAVGLAMKFIHDSSDWEQTGQPSTHHDRSARPWTFQAQWS